jgi:hypothetical protein
MHTNILRVALVIVLALAFFAMAAPFKWPT